MSEDSSAEAPSPKKSPSRKRSSGPRKKARKKADETPQPAGEAPQTAASETPKPAVVGAEPAASREAKTEAPSKPAGNGSEDKGRSRGGRNRRGRQRSSNAEGRPPQAIQNRKQKPINVKKLGKKAWHIYSTEVCEEGLRYIDESDANKLVRRSFRMAEIFLRYEQEQADTVNAPPPQPRSSRPAKSEDAVPSPKPESKANAPAEKAEAPAEEVETATEKAEAAEAPVEKTEEVDAAKATTDESADDDDEVIEPSTIDAD